MIGVVGGSFDPVHNGHVAVARDLLAGGALDQVVFMPVASHPLDKAVVAPFHHRVAMLKLAVAGEPGMSVSELEQELGGRSWTVDLLQALDRAYGRGNFCFIAGMDNLNTFFQWREWERLVREWPMVFTTRGGVPVDPEAVTRIEAAAGKPVLRMKRLDTPPDGPVLLEVPDIPVSSSEIRKSILSGGSPSDMMNPKVLAYIRDQRLYSTER